MADKKKEIDLDTLQKQVAAGELSYEEYRQRVDEAHAAKEAGDVNWKDRLAGGALGAASGAYYGMAGGPWGMVAGGLIGGTLGAVFPPRTLADAGMMVVPGAIGQGLRSARLVRYAPQLVNMMNKGRAVIGGLSTVPRLAVRGAQGAAEGLAGHAAYQTGTSLEQEHKLPSASELLPHDPLTAAIAVGGGSAARILPEVIGMLPFRKAASVRSADAADALGAGEVSDLPMAEPKPAMTEETTAQMQTENPNKASYAEMSAQNKKDLGDLKREKAQVDRELEKVQADLKLESQETAKQYAVEMAELSGREQLNANNLKTSAEKITGIRSTVSEVKSLKVNDYVKKTKAIVDAENLIDDIEKQLADIKVAEEIPNATRMKELNMQSTATPTPDAQAYMAETTTPRSAATVTPQGRGVRTEPYTSHPQRFDEKMALTADKLEMETRKALLQGELVQAQRARAEAVVEATRRAQEKYLTTNDPAIQKALKERASLRGQRTKLTKRQTELQKGKLEAEQQGRAGQHYAKYESVLSKKASSLTEEIAQAEELGERLNVLAAELENSGNRTVREFAWATTDEDRWKLFTGGLEGYQKFRHVFSALGDEAKDTFKAWFYQRLAKQLYNVEEETMSNFSKIFGEKAPESSRIDPLILKTLMGEQGAEDMLGIFQKIEAGSGSIWDRRFVKKTQSHISWLLALSVVSNVSFGHLGTAVALGGTTLVGVGWPKILNELGKNPNMRREFSRMLSDASGSITARAYPTLAKFFYEQGHPLGIDGEEEQK